MTEHGMVIQVKEKHVWDQPRRPFQGAGPSVPKIFGTYARAHSKTTTKLDVRKIFAGSTTTRDLFAIANLLTATILADLYVYLK